MFSFARIGLLAGLLALLLGGCQMSRETGGFNRAQLAALAEEGFEQTPRGWEFSMADRLLFASDESIVQPQQGAVVRRIGQRLLAVGIRRATVEGHADSTGSSAHNIRLSQSRADAVGRELAAAGFTGDGLTMLGLGSRYPVESNRTRDGRRENRRVVILITAP